MNRWSRGASLAVLLVAAALAAGACGGRDDGRPADSAATTPGPAGSSPMEAPPTTPADDELSGMSEAPAAADPIGQALATAGYVFDSWYAKDGPDDPRFYEDGVWHGPKGCWTCSVGPAGLGAALWARGALEDGAKRAAVIETFDRAIRTRQRPNGSYGDEGNSEAINVAFFAPMLGTALLALNDRLPTATRTRWTRSLQRSVRFLRENDELDWYVNGNINLSYSLAIYVTYLATGEGSLRDLYRKQLRFATEPPDGRWGDRGLELRKRPAEADGSDGRGYLTETGPGGTGYDPEYTYVQVDILTRLYLLSGEQRVLRLVNLLTNQTLQNVDDEWNLLTTGTRHPEPDRYVPFTTAALAVLDRLGGNEAMRDDVAPQVARTLELYRSATTFSHPNLYRGADTQLGTLLLALGAQRPADRRVFRRLRR